MPDVAEQPKPQSPERSRAVFSQQDFELIRVAIAYYLREVGGEGDRLKYSSLYHRLGRVG